MAFSQGFLEEIKNRNDIEQIIGRYLSLKRAGSNVVGLCPFHSEKTPSFTVFPATESFYCFGCGAGGDVVTFIMLSENLEYPDAVEYLAKIAGIPLEEEIHSGGAPVVKRDRINKANTEAAKFYHNALLSDTGAYALNYLRSRGFDPSTIKRFGLGFAPNSWEALTNHLLEQGFTPLELKTAFLIGIGKNERNYDMFRNRIMFPIFDIKGDVVAFSGRRLNEEDKAKYINTSDTPVFKKSRLLYGMHIAKNTEDKTLIICEGAPDTIALHQAGFSNAVAPLGTALTSEHARLIARYAQTVFLAYDIDSAGRAATEKAISLLNQVGVECRVVRLDGNEKDPDEYIQKRGAQAFRNRLNMSKGQVDYKIGEIISKYDLTNPDQKIRATTELTSYISTLNRKSEREIYSSRASELLGLSLQAVLTDVEHKATAKAKRAKRDYAQKSLQSTMGFGDKVNKDRLRFASEVMTEQAILGTLLLFPELAPRGLEFLDENSFVTEFNKKIFGLFAEELRQGKDVVLSKNGILTGEEIGVVSGYIANRRKLGPATPEHLKELIDQLERQRYRLEVEEQIKENPVDGITDYLASLKKDKE